MAEGYLKVVQGHIEAIKDLATKTERVYAEGQRVEISDGFHTMEELYDHRITLFIALCRKFLAHGNSVGGKVVEPEKDWSVWRSKKHSDGELCFGTGTQFVMGIGKEKGSQITYHIPIERWEETDFAETLDVAPEFDGHTSQDVIERLKTL